MSGLQRLSKSSIFIQNIGDAARHAGGKIAPGVTEIDDPAASHVFAAVIADAFHHRLNAAVAHAETFAGEAADIRLAARCAVESDVADDDVFFGSEGRISSAGRR